MTYKAYIDKNFSKTSWTRIEQANEIINEYEGMGYKLTLRQLYYQFVARDYIPNTEASYNSIGNLIADARLAGHVSWDAIEDRTRNLKSIGHWDSPADIIASARYGFALDKWADQEWYVEGWVEKEALAGVLQRVSNKWDIPYFSCRGYVSASEMFSAGQRMKDKVDEGKQVLLLDMGDHDPSGIDMTRDKIDRLKMFTDGRPIEVRRIALNWDQVETFRPPPNPAKTTDARFESYERKYGVYSWELDSLPPQVIESSVEEAVLEVVDLEQFKATMRKEKEMKAHLQKVERHWDAVTQFVSQI